MIVIFSNFQDEHAKVVAEKLKSNHDEESIILDLSQLTKTHTIEGHYLENSPPDFKLNFQNKETINLKDVKSFWWRRPQPLEINPEVKLPTHREFAFSEWYTALNGIWASTNAFWVNDISRDQLASHKPYQLTLAKKIGLEIPETLITNNPAEVVTFWKKHAGKVVYKPFLPTLQEWRETRPLQKEFLDLVNTVKYAPVIFQEYIAMAKDLRITIVGNEVFAAENSTDNSYQYDWRMTQSTWEKHKLPEYIECLLLKYMRKLGLEYGAIDMKLTKNGHYCFLEINTAGQFLFCEFDAKLPISDSLAKHLARANA